MKSGVIDEKEKFLIRNILDKQKNSESRNFLTSSRFLNERERVLAETELRKNGAKNYVFYGGYEEAQRTVAVFFPDYMSAQDIELKENNPLAFVRVSYYKDYELSHRDFLGALTGAGMAREAIGDILSNEDENTADIIIMNQTLSFILTEFDKAGKAKLKVSEIEQSELSLPKQKSRIINDTLASLRLDSVISSGFNLSRDKAVKIVESGGVELNYLPCGKPDKILVQGDKVSVRGSGKIILKTVGNLSKKGRIFIEIERLL